MVRHTRGGVENEYACRPSEPTKSLYGCAGRAPRPRKPARRKNREARPVRIVFISLGRNSSGAEAPFYLRVMSELKLRPPQAFRAEATAHPSLLKGLGVHSCFGAWGWHGRGRALTQNRFVRGG